MAVFFDNLALGVTCSITVYPGVSELFKIKPKTKLTFSVYIIASSRPKLAVRLRCSTSHLKSNSQLP